MISLKGFYDGKQIRLLEPIPKQMITQECTVIITFYEEEKVPESTKEAVQEFVAGDLLELDEVLGEL